MKCRAVALSFESPCDHEIPITVVGECYDNARARAESPVLGLLATGRRPAGKQIQVPVLPNARQATSASLLQKSRAMVILVM